MSYATPDDVAARFDLGDTTTQRVQILLDDVEQLILSKVPDLAARVAATPPLLTQQTVVMIECHAVIRYLDNPFGRTSENIDDYGWRRDGGDVRGGLYLTDDEWAMLTAATTPQGGAFEIVIGPG